MAKEKADVLVLCGQSNMEGASWLRYLSSEQRKKYDAGFPNVLINNCSYWTKATTAGHFVPVRSGQGFDAEHFGVELGLAEAASESVPPRKLFLIKYTDGGTTLYLHWRSPRSPFLAQPFDLYYPFLRFVNLAMKELEKNGYEPNLRAILWMQGESDGDGELKEKADSYRALEKDFILSLREDLSPFASQRPIPFLDALVNTSILIPQSKTINDAKKEVAKTLPNVVLIDTLAAGLSTAKEPSPTPDLWHYDAESEISLGHLFFQAVLPFLSDPS